MNTCHLTRVVLLAVWLPGLVAPVTGQDRPVEAPGIPTDLQSETPSDMPSGTRSVKVRGVKVELRGSGDFLAGEAVRVAGGAAAPVVEREWVRRSVWTG